LTIIFFSKVTGFFSLPFFLRVRIAPPVFPVPHWCGSAAHSLAPVREHEAATRMESSRLLYFRCRLRPESALFLPHVPSIATSQQWCARLAFILFIHLRCVFVLTTAYL
jgi:hypothetical protein